MTGISPPKLGTPERDAFDAGRQARRVGQPRYSSRHTKPSIASAWDNGWRSEDMARKPA